MVAVYPRKIPLMVWLMRLSDRRPGGRTHTRQPNVFRFLRSGRFFSHVLKLGHALSRAWCEIVDTKEMVECIWPIFHRQVRTLLFLFLLRKRTTQILMKSSRIWCGDGQIIHALIKGAMNRCLDLLRHLIQVNDLLHGSRVSDPMQV